VFCVKRLIHYTVQDLYSCVVWKMKINTGSAKFCEPFRLPRVLEFLYCAACQEHILCVCTWLNDILFFQPVFSNRSSFTQFTLQLRHEHAFFFFFSVGVSCKDCHRLPNCGLNHNPFLHYNDCLKSALKCVNC
jgi:hypothetical protein